MLHNIYREVLFFMKTFLPSTKHKGFTLIELLIVIALLGALAIGLLATIDPFEQLKKGRDTSMRNTVSEYYNANLRYYSTKGEFPWENLNGTEGTAANVYTMSDVSAELISAGELKERFVELAGTANLANIYVNSTSETHMTVCFDPESKSFDEDPNTVYDASGGTATLTDCKAAGAGSNESCYYCIL